jgi:ZIP family zinc transporter
MTQDDVLVTTSHHLFAFSLTLLAGLATGVGSFLALFARRTNTRFLAGALGFSAGVMIYVSFAEILRKAQASLSTVLGERLGAWVAAGAFFAGMGLIALIDRVVPQSGNPHEARGPEDMKAGAPLPRRALLRLGLVSAVAIGLHNFPEGIATFVAALQEPRLGVPVAVAIAIHNVPEGIAVAVPVYYATGSRGKAFTYSFLSGLSEPVGALLGFILVRSFTGDAVLGVVFGMVAGIMVFISLDQLLPAAQRYGEHHAAVYSMVAGMAVMAVSLLLFQ